MPNYVTNVLTLHGDPAQIRAMLEAIQYDDLGIGSVDFNKIIPMSESLDIEAGSQTDTGLKAYQDFIEVYTLGGTKLGKAAWNNIRLYGVPTWYEWCNQHWGTNWNAYGYGEAKVNYKDGDVLNFLAAGSAPHPVMEKLAEMFPMLRSSTSGQMSTSAKTVADTAIRTEYGSKNGLPKQSERPLISDVN